MPLLVRPATAPPPPPPPPTAPARTVINLTDPSGREWSLSHGRDGIWMQPGRRGFDAPPYQHYDDESPAIHGALHRGVRALVRELFMPIYLTAATRQEHTALRRELTAAISPLRGVCRLTVAHPDTPPRHIDCRYAGGLEGQTGPGEWGVTKSRYGLVMRALDPYWYGDEAAVEWMPAVAGLFFPVPPLVVGPSQVLGATTVTNPGDVDAYPVWRIDGPCTSIQLVRDAGAQPQKTSHLVLTLGQGESVTVDTRPGVRQIYDGAGANRRGSLQPGSSLWTLPRGQSTLTITVDGSGAATKTRLAYRPRFEAA